MENKALIIIDINNGFAKKGALYNERVEKLINPITEYAKQFKGKILAFTDSHKKDSIEFESYPVHCLEGTWESEVVDELKAIKDLMVIKKNTTNGFLERDFQGFLDWNKDINKFEIVGCLTDICVYQFAVTLKTYFTHIGKNVEVIVKKDLVDTFDSVGHNAEEINKIFLDSMMANGIKIQ